MSLLIPLGTSRNFVITYIHKNQRRTLKIRRRASLWPVTINTRLNLKTGTSKTLGWGNCDKNCCMRLENFTQVWISMKFTIFIRKSYATKCKSKFPKQNKEHIQNNRIEYLKNMLNYMCKILKLQIEITSIRDFEVRSS